MTTMVIGRTLSAGVAAIAIAGLTAFGTAQPAQAFSITTVGSDVAFNALPFSKAYGYKVFEGGTTFETAIFEGEAGQATLPNGQGEVVWPSTEVDHTFAFDLDAALNAALGLGDLGGVPANPNPLGLTPVSLTTNNNVGGGSLESLPGLANTIAIRARKLKKPSTESEPKVELSDLILTLGAGPAINLGGLVGDDDGNYIVISGLDLSQGFSLTGDVAFDIGDTAGGFRTGYEAKVGYAPTVPIPAALPMLVAAIGGLGFASWRNRSVS